MILHFPRRKRWQTDIGMKQHVDNTTIVIKFRKVLGTQRRLPVSQSMVLNQSIMCNYNSYCLPFLFRGCNWLIRELILMGFSMKLSSLRTAWLCLDFLPFLASLVRARRNSWTLMMLRTAVRMHDRIRLLQTPSWWWFLQEPSSESSEGEMPPMDGFINW